MEEMDQDIDENEIDLTPLEKGVQENPSNYDAHLALIDACRKCGELEKLRDSRQNMSKIFPLSPNLWLDWIKDELVICEGDSNNQVHKDHIRSLFQKATNDYTSFDLWIEYVQWACGTGDTALTREIFEQAIVAVGLHVSKGCLIWDAYREFENALLSLLVSKQDTESESSSSLDDAVLKHKSIVLSIFKRQLALPLIGIEESYQEYLIFLNLQEPEKRVVTSYESALKILEVLKPYEDQLTDCQEDKVQLLAAYKNYLEFELTCTSPASPPARIKCLFERALTDHCLDVELWLKYLNWLDNKLKDKDLILDAYGRAVRNCPWSTAIWQAYLLSVEFLDVSDGEDMLNAIFKKALTDGAFYTAKECSHLWLSRIYQIRRRLAGCQQPDYSELRRELEKGAAYLKEKFSALGWDSDCYYRQCWGRLEAELMKDMSAFRKLYDEIMAEGGNSKKTSAWLEYINMERAYGTDDAENWQHVRRLYFRAVNSVSDYPETIFAQFVQFELECGNLVEYKNALQRIEQQRLRIKERSAAQVSKQPKGKTLPTKEKPDKKRPSFEVKAQFEVQSPAKFKRKAEERESVPKRNKVNIAKSDDAEFAVPTLPSNPRPSALAGASPNPSATDGVLLSKTAESGGLAGVDVSKYDRTVFVSNLDFKVDADAVKQVFVESPGHVTDVRLVMLKPGRSKGFGYVEFENANFAAEALKMDRHKIDGRPMYVSKCVDKQQHSVQQASASVSAAPPVGFTFNTGLEKNKLFVKNVHGRATESDLTEFFRPYGKLLSVRLVIHKSGQSKGLAYVEYADESSAAKALTATDQALLMGRKLTVALSNPPPRQSRLTAETGQSMSTSFSLGRQGPVVAAAAMMRPRAVVRPADQRRPHFGTAGASDSHSSTLATQNGVQPNVPTTKSNEQFRQMFLGR